MTGHAVTREWSIDESAATVGNKHMPVKRAPVGEQSAH